MGSRVLWGALSRKAMSRHLQVVCMTLFTVLLVSPDLRQLISGMKKLICVRFGLKMLSTPSSVAFFV